jgi:hypothetical protein
VKRRKKTNYICLVLYDFCKNIFLYKLLFFLILK